MTGEELLEALQRLTPAQRELELEVLVPDSIIEREDYRTSFDVAGMREQDGKLQLFEQPDWEELVPA